MSNTAKHFVDGWDHVVTFSGKQTNKGHVYVDAGTTEDNPIVFAATADDNGLDLTSSGKNLVVGFENANGYLKLTRGTYKMHDIQIGHSTDDGLTRGGLTLDPGDESSVSLTVNNMWLHAGTATLNGGNVTVGSILHIANRDRGVFILNDGEVDVASKVYFGGYYATDPVLYLNGGTLATPTITWHNGNTAPIVRFQGGTLKAKGDGTLIVSQSDYDDAKGELNVMIDNNRGGTIDNNGFSVSIDATIGGKGSMTFTGTGTTTLNAIVNYSGATYVTPGTTLAVENSDAKANILKNGLVLAGLPVADQTVVTSTSAFEDADLTKVSCPLAPTTTFKFTDETKTGIAVDVPGEELDNYWKGAANDGDLSNADNWSGGSVPQSGNAYIFCTTNSMLTKGGTFAPSHITFVGGSAAATINGDFSDIVQIANNSAGIVEFTGAVAFSGNVDVLQNSGAVKFTGGATGIKLARAMDLHGTYNFTQANELTEIAGTVVKSDGVYKLLNGTFFKHNKDFHVEAGGKAVVKNAKISHNNGKTLLGKFNGLFVVTNQFSVQGSKSGTHYMRDTGSGTFIVNELRVGSAGVIVPAVKTIMGPGGIIRGTGWVRVTNSGSHEFGSYADWTMCYNNKGVNTSTGMPVLYKQTSSSSWSYLTFDTTDYYDSAIGRTITCEAPIGAQDAASAKKFRVTVKGKGTFVFANTHDDKNKTEKIFSGGLVVQDTATVEVKAGAKPGTGEITLNAGTTLALDYSSGGNGSALLANKLNLPTEGAATIRIDGKRLGSGDYEITTIGSGNIENVALDLDCSALDGRKASLRVDVENGKLFLNIKPDGFKVIVR